MRHRSLYIGGAGDVGSRLHGITKRASGGISSRYREEEGLLRTADGRYRMRICSDWSLATCCPRRTGDA